MCKQCGVSVVGLERKTERVAAAKRREHIHTCNDCDGDEESCDLSAMSCDSQVLSCCPKGPSHDNCTKLTCSSLQCSSHVTTEWSLHLSQLLPVDLKWPFYVSTQLNVDTTHQSTAKLHQLLLRLRRKFSPVLSVFLPPRSSSYLFPDLYCLV